MMKRKQILGIGLVMALATLVVLSMRPDLG